jgi:hypothetical protein
VTAEPYGQGATDAFGSSEIDSLRAEVRRLEAEQARLQAQLAARSGPGRSQHLRRTVTALLAGVCCVLIFLSALTVWIHQTAISTSGFVAAVGPVIDRPAVSEAMSVELTDQIFAAVDVEHELKSVLPPAQQFLAAPLANAAKGFIQGQVLNVIRSPQFRSVWIAVLRATHREVIAALRGQSNVLVISNGVVVLNVLPLVNTALKQVQALASGLLGRDVTIPNITSGEIPAQIRSTLSKALGVNLPADFGQIALARSSSLDVATFAVQLLDVLYWLLPLVTLLAIASALWLSPNRRRTLLQILAGTAVALVVEKRAESWIQSRVVSSLGPANRAAGGDVVHQVLSGLATATWWLLVIALVAVAFLLVTGPYTWARSIRRHVGGSVQGAGRTIARRTGHQAGVTWVAEHRRVMQGGGALVGGVLLLLVPGWWFVAVAVLLAAYEVAVWRAGPVAAAAPGAVDGTAPLGPPPGTGPPGDATISAT